LGYVTHQGGISTSSCSSTSAEPATLRAIGTPPDRTSVELQAVAGWVENVEQVAFELNAQVGVER